MIHKLVKLLFGDYNEKYIRSLNPLVLEINKQEEEYQSLSEEVFLQNTNKLKEKIANGQSTDDILVEAFATVKNACRRLYDKKHTFTIGKHTYTWDMIPYDVQLIGGIILHRGKISEMKTGEGKTLVCVAPLYLNALEGKGAHLITANEYLAERDALWMGQVFNYLGLSVGIIKHGQSPLQKKESYASDITYGTNNEFGFDYLRDNMAIRSESQVMRDLHFAIVDEVDSILIDESRTPLIISAPDDDATTKYQQYKSLVQYLEKDTHYILDEKEKTVILSEAGIKKMEELMGIENIYTDRGFEEVHHIEAALKAKALFHKDKDYIISEGEIIIVDEFTGRLMPGRRYSGGLHQAIEAKEGVEVQQESKTLATITFQNFFRIYKKLAGMTGTALTEAKEFAEIYALDTVVVPTHRPIARKDLSDAIFKNAHGKYTAIINKVKTAHEKGQPVLIGTISIEKSELLSTLLEKAGLPHTVLNAKHHEKEADIIMSAGVEGAITIATNMAGRGTDIKLTETSQKAGGLLVIGTERHESRRIDNQLRGRSGRQGDPGETQFFVSMDDDLMRLFGGKRMQGLMQAMQIPDDMPIENSMITGAIESAQKKVEARNFEIRKHLLQYDNTMNIHREKMYSLRNSIVRSNNIRERVMELFEKYIPQLTKASVEGLPEHKWNYEDILASLKQFGDIDSLPTVKELERHAQGSVIALTDYVLDLYKAHYVQKEASCPSEEAMRSAERSIYLRNIDSYWMAHIDNMTKLRETVSLQAYANKNPLYEYQHQAFEAFKTMVHEISLHTIRDLMSLNIEVVERVEAPREINPNILLTNEAQIESGLQGSHIVDVSAETQTGGIPYANPQVSDAPIRVIDANTPEISSTHTVGRNDLCPCGSGKKYKKCCGA